MNILSKIILTLISISIFVFLIFVTYITNSFSTFEKPYYKNVKIGLFELNKSDDNILSFSNISDQSKIIVNKINLTDKIIFSSGSLEINTASGNTNISITPGIYFFDLKEINTKYVIKGKGFQINNKGPGMFIINNLNTKKSLIFSINSLLNLNLKNIRTNTEVTSIDLYPHTYLIFNPAKNVFVKNSDLLKISQTFILDYFSDKILNNDTQIVNEKFLELISIKNEKNHKIINDSLMLINQELKENKNIIENFIKSNFGVLPGEEFINKYFSFLKNPNKKSLYYKNIITRNLNKLLTDNNLNNKNINIIVNNINQLGNIDEKGYEEMKNIISFYYSSVLKSNQEINIKINFSKLMLKITTNSSDFNLSSLVFLEKLFFEYDFLENIDFYKNISIFKNYYFEDLNLDINGNNTNELEKNNIAKINYLLFFIENILMSDFAYSNNETNDLINIFSDYINIANAFYLNSNDKIKRTGIFKYSKILNKFVGIFENKYFLKERNKNMLLIINEKEKIDINDILILEKNINKIITFFNNNKLLLKSNNNNNKDKLVIKLYSILKEKYKEYFSALKNYEEYTTKYDDIKKELLNTKSINENNDLLVLSKSHAINYLQNFNGLQLNNTDITIMDYSYCESPNLKNKQIPIEIPYCYLIKNLLIDSINVSFILYPFEKNKIDEIIVNNKNQAGSYKLDEIKILLDEKIKTESENKDKYDFKNFLLSTFGQKIIEKKYVNNNNNTYLIEEDAVIKIFKRNKLLGEAGDFANLEGFLSINYNDLIVQKINNAYSINVKFGIFNIDLGKNKKFYGDFSSIYNFSPKHSFINPKIKIVDKQNKKDLLLGNYINITGEYEVNLVKEEIKKVFQNYNVINFTIDEISKILKKSEIKITYMKDTKKILFELNYEDGKINITIENGNIIVFTYNDISKIQKILPYTELTNILNNIK